MDHVAAQPAIASSSSEVVKSPLVKKQRVLDTGPSKERDAATNFLSMLGRNEGANSKEALDRLEEIGDKVNRGPVKVLDTWDDDLSLFEILSFIDEDSKLLTCSDINKLDSSRLLSDVVFVISGFQNPLRSDIRRIGLSLGAQYRSKWCSEATHLICGIPNSPKFNQAKGKGIIVGMEWLFHCQMDRCRVSETHYRLDKLKLTSKNKVQSGKRSFKHRKPPEMSLARRKYNAQQIKYAGPSKDGKAAADFSSKLKRNKAAISKEALARLKEIGNKGFKGGPVNVIDIRDDDRETYRRLDQPNSIRQNEAQADKRSCNYRKPPGMSLARRRYIQQIQYAEGSDIEEERISSSEGEKESLEPIEISSDDEDVPELNPVSKPPLPDISDSESETEDTNVYEAETDEESEASVIERLGLPPLPNFFSGHRFFIHADSFEDAEDVSLLHRYLVAYGGKVFDRMSPEVSFIVTKSQNWLSDFKQALFVNSKVKFLSSSWVEASNKQLKAVPKSSYYIRQ